MATDNGSPIPPMPEPWQMLHDLAYRLDWLARHTTQDDPADAAAEMRDALETAMLDLLNIVKFYRTDREHPVDVSRDFVMRYTVMARRADGTTEARDVFTTEQDANLAATQASADPDVAHAWVRRSLVSVVAERLNETMKQVLAETGLTEDELVDAIAHHPA